MTVLVFGAEGFLGRHIVRALGQAGESVWSVVQPNLLSSSQSPAGVVGTSVLDPVVAGPGALIDLLAQVQPTVVVNAAGATRGDLVQLVNGNVGLVAVIIEGLVGWQDGAGPASASGSSRPRFIHIGSAAEYGAAGARGATSETDATRPTTPYGVTKLAGTSLVGAAGAAGTLDGVVLRVFNPVGPGCPPANLGGRAASALRAAIERGESTLSLGDLSAFRDFVDVRDVADAVVSAAQRDSALPGVLNVGSGRAVPARELVSELVSAAGWSGNVLERGQGSSASAGVDWQQADISRTTTSLDWVPWRPLRDSARDLWAESGALA